MSDEEDNRPLPPRLEDVPPERLISIGGPVRKFNVTLRVSGDDLDPDEVSTLLQTTPTWAYRKGDRLRGRYHRLAKEGAWMLRWKFEESEIELQEAITQLLDRLNSDPPVWASLSHRYKCEISCGLFLGAGGGNEGFSLTSATSRQLADRGLEIGFDLYYGL